MCSRSNENKIRLCFDFVSCAIVIESTLALLLFNFSAQLSLCERQEKAALSSALLFAQVADLVFVYVWFHYVMFHFC